MMYTAKGQHKAMAAKNTAYLSMPISPPSEGIGPAMRTEQIQPVLPPMASAVGGRYTEAASRALVINSVSNKHQEGEK